RRDRVGNVCVCVPATAGRESQRVVVLQAHLDMVCEKDAGSDFDFSRGAIEVAVEGEWVVGKGTTLGADNGIGVAAALAVCEDPNSDHGPVELLFTVDEEASLRGAKEIDPSLVQGRILLNLDAENDEEIVIGCAGGSDTEIEYGARRAPAPDGLGPYKLGVSGLLGGHSGLSIHENRGNAIRILARILRRCLREQEIFVWGIEGGNKPTAIPREAHAVFYAAEKFVPRAQAIADEVSEAFLREIGVVDSNLRVTLEAAEPQAITPFDCSSTRRLVRLLNALPHGVLAMSRTQPAHVHSSTNLASVRTDVDRVTIVLSSRSMLQWSLDGILNQIDAISRLAGAATEESSAYAPWHAQESSHALAVAASSYEDVFGTQPRRAVIHGGLECGPLSERIPGIDMVSFGPRIEGAHAPGERVNIPSVQRFDAFLRSFLPRVSLP
ncbi:MAG: beta-Ala-His dipeptidase, partial [Myxococcota bacterium]